MGKLLYDCLLIFVDFSLGITSFSASSTAFSTGIAGGRITVSSFELVSSFSSFAALKKSVLTSLGSLNGLPNEASSSCANLYAGPRKFAQLASTTTAREADSIFTQLRSGVASIKLHILWLISH